MSTPTLGESLRCQRRWRTTWLLTVAVILLAAKAGAWVGPPVEVRVVSEPAAAAAGEVYTGEISIRTGTAAEVRDIIFRGSGWQPVSSNAPAVASLAAGEELRVSFTLRPTDPDQRLVVEFLWNGMRIKKSFDLSSAHLARVAEPGAVEPVPASLQEPFLGVDESMIRPEPERGSGDDEPESTARDGDEGDGSRDTRDIRVWGRFVYLRDDNVIMGGDGIKVEVHDDEAIGSDELGTSITDVQGYFDFVVTWDSWEADPDLFVRFEAINSEIEVQDETWFITYRWRTETEQDFPGTSWYVGEVWPGDEFEHGAVHIMTDLVRTWRWYNNRGYDCTDIDVMWPDDDRDVSFYQPAPWRNIHITTGATWSEETHSHEYTHHFFDDFAEREDPDYCNPGGFCDDDDDCGHCVFCRENAYVALSEGIANFGGHTIPDAFLDSYGRAAQHITPVDTLRNCFEDGNLHDSTLTEGIFAAMLVDIEDTDATPDNHVQFPNYEDGLELGGDEILACIDTHHPMSAMEFLFAFKADNYEYRYELWETGMNCGYDIDTEDPDPIESIWSSSHLVGEPSPDNTITMTWVQPSDDAAGVGFYSISWSNLPEDPGNYLDLGDVVTVTSDELEPGTWFFNIRPRDRAGNWCDDHTSWGPLIIREPEDADLVFFLHTGWDYTLVPSSESDNEVMDCTVSPTLPGNVYGTYWNMTARNQGEATTSENAYSRLYADEQSIDLYNHGQLPQWATAMVLNEGPVKVPGGRHVLHSRLDPYENIPETNEHNNDWGHQFVWTPLVLDSTDVVYRTTPGFIFAGWDAVNDGSDLYLNVDGLYFPGNAWWNIVVSWPEDLEEFYPIALFMPTTGAEAGFQSSLATSFRPAGCLTGVIVNQNEVAQDEWNVGVSNWSPEVFDYGYRAVYLTNGGAVFNADLTHSFDEDEFLAMKEFYASSSHVGSVSLHVTTDPPTSPVYVQWRDEWFTYGDLLDCTAETVTDAEGWAHLRLDITESGYNSIAFWRDPKDGNAPFDLHYRLEMTPPDFMPNYPANWHSPAVPRPDTEGNVLYVDPPDTLHGGASSTYYNFTFRNDSPGDTVDLNTYIYLDGEEDAAFHFDTYNGHVMTFYRWPEPQTVVGGRHTFAMMIDPQDTVHEIREDNNVYGEQYCWSPYPLAENQTRFLVPLPPDRMGGWEDVRSGEPLWFNCDGYRLLDPDGWWTACAVIPADASNVDVRLHPVLVGAKEGYAENLVYSGWGTAQSDYVLVNHNMVPRDEVDAAVLKISGIQNYGIHYASSTFIAHYPSGEYGPFLLGPQKILGLHEVTLPPGIWNVRLEHLSGNVDWGLSLHPHDLPYQSKSTTVEDGSSWVNPVGEDETISVEITESGYFCVAVWKAHSYGLMQNGLYRLVFSTGVTAVDPEDELPAATALSSIYPNPFNPQTTVAYELAVAGDVDLAVYDLKGARVRTLVADHQSAGRYRVVWNGRSDRGEPLASGVYVARLVSGEVRQMRKLTLLE